MPVGKERTNRKWNLDIKTLSSDSLPLMRLYLSKIMQTSKASPDARFNKDISHSNHNTLYHVLLLI